MTDKERYIKQVFKQYKENKKRLRDISFESVRGVDYSRPRLSKTTPQGNENALAGYLDQKAELEKQIMIVDRTMWYYRVDGSVKCDYIQARWIKGYTLIRTAQECFISESTANAWGKEIYKRAERVADVFNLWGGETAFS